MDNHSDPWKPVGTVFTGAGTGPTKYTCGLPMSHPKYQLIEIPHAELDHLIADHTSPEVLQFGSDEMVKMFEGLFEAVSSPEVSSANG